MRKFILKDITDVRAELDSIGFCKGYDASDKYLYRNIKIFDISPAQGNILKQTALSVGCDCAVHRDVITGKIERSDCILGGSVSQLRKVCDKLHNQPFGLKDLALQIISVLDSKLNPLETKSRTFDFTKPYLVGVLNLGESFSDGYTNFESAREQLYKLIDDGADIIDIGAESTRPNASEVDADTQLEKILPILNLSKEKNAVVSIDTRSSKVAREALLNGADIINDVSGLDFDSDMASVIAEFDCPVVIQHTTGTPDVMQTKTEYDNLIEDIFNSLRQKVDKAIESGISENKIILDVGIGFGKTKSQNIELIKRIEEFFTLKTPIMVGISRKSFLPEPKDVYTLGFNAMLIAKGVNFLRVHDVATHKQLIDAYFI